MGEAINSLSETLFPPGALPRFDTIIGTQRGGVMAGTLLMSTVSGYMQTPPVLSFMPAIYTNGQEIKDCPKELLYLKKCIEGKRVLLIDDVCVTGKTLARCKGMLETLKPSSISTATMLDFDTEAGNIDARLKKNFPDFIHYKVKQSTVPPWRPFPSIGVPFMLNISCSKTECIELLSEFAKKEGYSLRRSDDLIVLDKELNGSYSTINVILADSNTRGTELRLMNTIVSDDSFAEIHSPEELEEMRQRIAETELMHLVRYLRVNEKDCK